MIKLRWFAAVAALLLVSAPVQSVCAADDSNAVTLAESTGAFGGALLWSTYLGFVQTEQQLNAAPKSVQPINLALHMANLGTVEKYIEKLRGEFKSDQSMLEFLNSMAETTDAVKAQGSSLQDCLKNGPKGLDDVKEKHTAAKAALVKLLGMQEAAAKLP